MKGEWVPCDISGAAQIVQPFKLSEKNDKVKEQ